MRGGGGQKENDTDGRETLKERTERKRERGIVGGGMRKMTKVKRKIEGGRESSDRSIEEEER